MQRQILEWNEQKDKLLEEAEKKAAEKIEQASKEAEDIIQELRSIKMSIDHLKKMQLIYARKRLKSSP
ncbi:recombination and DNA strand exchange inhibitor protein [Bacillus safensis FO-36b] [Bacillus safensis subsp. safensis]